MVMLSARDRMRVSLAHIRYSGDLIYFVPSSSLHYNLQLHGYCLSGVILIMRLWPSLAIVIDETSLSKPLSTAVRSTA